MAPIIILIIAAIADFGSLVKQSTALAGATRIGAEYARYHAADLTGIKGDDAELDELQSSALFSGRLSPKLRMR